MLQNYNPELFLSDLKCVPFQIVDIFDDSMFNFDVLNELFLDTLIEHAPIKRIKIKSRSNPFITPEIKQLMKTRDSWHKKARKTNDKLHWNAFRFFRQEVKREIRMAEKEYVRSELLKCNGNTNSIWKVINHCLPNKEPPLTTVEDPVIQANRFNDFYVWVGEAAATKAKALCNQFGFSDESVEEVEPTTDDLQNVNKFEFHAVTERDIEKIVKHIPSNKAPGQDKVSARVLKDSLAATRAVITNLIYSSFASNCFAQAWKFAVVIPNLKSGDPDEPENTHPIALLPIMSKVCERAAHTFLDFLDKNSKITGLQSGNRKFHSTETALLHYTTFVNHHSII